MNDYDVVYKNNIEYNEEVSEKFIYTDKIFENFIPLSDRIVDLGCGKGHYCRRYSSKGYNIIGVEPSDYCCENFLKDVEHYNSDIIEFSENNNKYDSFICMDVLEHIEYGDIDQNLECLKSISNFGIIGIANHKEIVCGRRLHKIIENNNWWESKLLQHFKYADLICDIISNRFFIFIVKNT